MVELIALPSLLSMINQRASSHITHLKLAVWMLALAAVNPYSPLVGNTHNRFALSIFTANAFTASTKRMSTILSIENDSKNQQNIAYGCVNLAGTDPDRPQKVNQDGSFCLQTDCKCLTLFGVMDGHGLKGHALVQHLQQNLPLCMEEYLSSALRYPNTPTDDPVVALSDAPSLRLSQELLDRFKQDLIEYGHADPLELYLHPKPSNPPSIPKDDIVIRQAIVDAFLSVQYQASQNPNVPSSRSGTTCICCILIQEHDVFRLYTASVGDSRAILLAKSSAHEGSFTVQSLTEATTVEIETERNRIMSCESRIDASGNVFYGPIGIAMTRSLGNSVMLQAGILPIPIITMKTLSALSEDTHYYVCAGTDGIFDVLSNDQVAKIVDESLDAPREHGEIAMPLKLMQDIANDVCHQARLAWLDDLPIEPKVDDITFAILDVFCQGKKLQD